jgi:hypothetical protein
MEGLDSFWVLFIIDQKLSEKVCDYEVIRFFDAITHQSVKGRQKSICLRSAIGSSETNLRNQFYSEEY